jgi:hypothetical protein
MAAPSWSDTAGPATELVYRHQLRPVIQTGAMVMDQLFEPDTGTGTTGNWTSRRGGGNDGNRGIPCLIGRGDRI